MKDIENIEDIKVFVDAFYEKIREDELLAPIFAMRITPEAWPAHLEKMYGFWNTVLFHKPDYKGAPFARHIGLPVETRHFEHWADVFKENMDELFTGEKADDAKSRAANMAQMFAAKMEFLKTNPKFRYLA